MVDQLLAPLNPNPKALAGIFQANVDDDMLREIAQADYGNLDDHCFALLRQVLSTGQVASEDPQLRNVLELTRWGPRSAGLRGNWVWLFACTSLLQLAAVARDPESIFSECETLAPFVCRSIDLGEGVARAAASVLAWRFLNYAGGDEDSVFLTFAILLLSAHLERQDDRGPWLNELAAWVEREEARVRRLNFDDEDASFSPSIEDDPVDNRWLLGLTVFRHFEGLWRYLAQTVLVAPKFPHPRDAADTLRRLGILILGA